MSIIILVLQNPVDISPSTSYEDMSLKLSELPFEDEPEQLGVTTETWLMHKQTESMQLQQFICQLDDRHSNQKM